MEQIDVTDERMNSEKKAIFNRKMRLLDLYGACMSNAGKLIDEAKILIENRAFSRAAFLAYCSLEETGKAQIVADFYNGDLSEAMFKKGYFDHTTKAAYTSRKVEVSGSPMKERATQALSGVGRDTDELAVEEVWRIDKFCMHVDQGTGNAYRKLREPALYVEFDAEFKPILPEDRVDQQGAEAIVAIAFKTWRRILETDATTEGIGARGHFK